MHIWLTCSKSFEEEVETKKFKRIIWIDFQGGEIFSPASLVHKVSGYDPPDCQPLSREEAWEFYLAKLDEEANYLTVPGEFKEDICACPSCTVSG